MRYFEESQCFYMCAVCTLAYGRDGIAAFYFSFFRGLGGVFFLYKESMEK